MSSSPTSGCARRFEATIAALARPADLRSLPLVAVHLVLGLRLCGVCEAVGRDAAVELTRRLHSVTAAVAVVELAAEVARVWPEPFATGRPCMTALSHDERTLAELVRAGLAADRERFSRAIDGLVRNDRHERLYAAVVGAAAALPLRPA